MLSLVLALTAMISMYGGKALFLRSSIVRLSKLHHPNFVGHTFITSQLFATKNAQNVSKKSKSVGSTKTGPIANIATPKLTISPETNEEEFNIIMKEYRKSNSFRKMVNTVEECGKFQILSLNMTKSALRMVQIGNRTDLATHLWSSYLSSKPIDIARLELIQEPDNAAYLLKYFAKIGNMTVAEDICSLIGIDIHATITSNTNTADDRIYQNMFKTEFSFENREFYCAYYSDLLSQLCLGHATALNFTSAEQTLAIMSHYRLTMDLEVSKKVLKIYLRESNPQRILQVIDKMFLVNALYDTDSLQLVTGTFLRDIRFVTGAVTMTTLPPQKVDMGEVTFIGRSNVGKSSLINALTNRKNLAFTSKTAGKTSEFNYFRVEGLVGEQKEKPRFYLIDMPGVGYAARPKGQRSNWSELMQSFTAERSTLKCIFHLVDSRHGVLDADDECFELLPFLPDHVQYVIVLTKVDKLRAKDISSSEPDLPVTRDVVRNVRQKLAQLDLKKREVPILYSSAESRQGVLKVLHTALKAVSVVKDESGVMGE